MKSGFGKRFRLRDDFQLPLLGLSLTLWEGQYEDITETWLRWCDQDGNIIPSGKEGRIAAESRANQAESEVARLQTELARLRDSLAK